MKKTILLSALALGALTSAALAEPVVLSDTLLDTVTAGQDDNVVTQTNTSSVDVAQSNTSTVGGDDNEVTQSNASTVTVTQSNNSSIGPAPAAE